MTVPERPVPEPAVSLKYMAWNVKEISGYMKEIACNLVILNNRLGQCLGLDKGQISCQSQIQKKPQNVFDDTPF